VTAALLLLLLLGAAAAPGGEAAPPAKPATPPPGTVKLRLTAMGQFGFVTPREARQDYPRLTVADGKAGLPVAGLEAHIRGGGVAVVPTGGKVENAVAVALPRTGFSAALTAEAKGADGGICQVAVAFAPAGKPGEYFVRNVMAAVGQYGDYNITLVDENCNGRFSDAGEDAVMVGRGALAVPLGATVMVGRTLHGIQVAENGQSVLLTPKPETQVGTAIVSRTEGMRQLIGAVLKDSAGGFHLVGDREAAFLPVGNHSLAFASLGSPQAGAYAILQGGDATFAVPETGNRHVVLNFGRPEVKISASYDPKSDDVRIEPPSRDAVTCRAGTFRFFFALADPKVEIFRLGTRDDHRQSQVSMPVDGSAMRAPRALVLDRSRHDLDRGKKYRFELSWSSGVVEDARGSAVLEIPFPTPPPPKTPGGKK